MLDAEVCGSHLPVSGLLSAELFVLVVSSLLANEALGFRLDHLGQVVNLCLHRSDISASSIRTTSIVTPVSSFTTTKSSITTVSRPVITWNRIVFGFLLASRLQLLFFRHSNVQTNLFCDTSTPLLFFQYSL